MKLQFSELKKALDYIDKNSDRCDVNLSFDTINESLSINFNTLDGSSVQVVLHADERKFSKITKTERF